MIITDCPAYLHWKSTFWWGVGVRAHMALCRAKYQPAEPLGLQPVWLTQAFADLSLFNLCFLQKEEGQSEAEPLLELAP